ncbi:MAG: spermidine/putrescine ABC transporter substrate-binding protein [Treponemataceae bacterium]|nr:MAG: spermidine/putrescine ABC transporter substrate-binding protein [Treponemataceae bacterium]
MKKLPFIVSVLACALVWAGCGNKQQLTLYTWDEMFPQEILSGFEKETGIRINYAHFVENEEMLARLQSAKGGGYDLVIADDYIIELVIQENLARKLDKTKLSNFLNINPVFQRQFYDPADEYTVPYGAGVVTIMYDPRRVTAEITGYADLWDPSLKKNVGLTGNFRVINGMALKTLGESYNTSDISVIRAAGGKLLALAPNVRLIHDDRLEDQLVAGEIAAAVMYTSNVYNAKNAEPELRAVFPREGIGFGIMAGFIPVNAPNPGAAHAFLNYILDPARGAECFEYLGYYSTYSASDPFISPEHRELLTLPAGFNIDMEMIRNIDSDALEAHNRIWNEFRAAAGQSD